MSRPNTNRRSWFAAAAIFLAIAPISNITGAEEVVETTAAGTGESTLAYPETPRGNVVETYHGIEVADPYRWLENSDSEAVKEWQWAQDTVANQFLSSPHRRRLRKQFQNLRAFERVGFARRAGGYNFYGRFTDFPADIRIIRQEPQTGSETTIAGPPLYGRTADHDQQILFAAYRPAPNGRFVALASRLAGSTRLLTRIFDITSGTWLSEDIRGMNRVLPSVTWAADSAGFYYSRFSRDENEDRGPAVYFHAIGTDQSADRLVSDSRGGNGIPTVTVSGDGRFLVISWRDGSALDSEIFVRSLDNPAAPLRHLFREQIANYHFLGARGSQGYFYTNHDAPRGRIIRTDLSAESSGTVHEIVPELDDAIFDNTLFGFGGMGLFGDCLVIAYTRHGSPYLRIFKPDGEPLHSVDMTPGSLLSAISGQPNDPYVLIGSQHLTTPSQLQRLDVRDGAITDVVELDFPFEPDDFVTRSFRYPSADGTMIPAYLVGHRATPLAGSAPAYLYAYGAFGWNATLFYRDRIVKWLQSGGLYIQPGVRGGGEYGKSWAEAGRKTNRPNVIADYLSAADWIIDRGWTRRGRIVANGGSASGYLPAVAIQRRPHLFAAAVIDFPVLDLLRFEQFNNGRYWSGDIGSPSDPKVFEVLRNYSPVHNAMTSQCYPPTLVMMGELDQSAHPAHSRKWVAAMQHAQACDNPVLLNVMVDAGHNYGNTPKASLTSNVDHMVFLSKALGLPMGKEE